MIVDQHVIGAGGIVGIDVLATSVGIDQLGYQCVVTFWIAFEKQDHTDPFFATALGGFFVIVGVIVGVFIGQGKIMIVSGGTSRVTAGMDKDVDDTFKLFQEVRIRHAIALAKFEERSFGFVEGMGWMTVGRLGIHAFLYQLQQFQHIGGGVDVLPVDTGL